MKAAVKQVTSYEIIFDNGWRLFSHHPQQCCEDHYLDISSLSLDDFDGLEFDLSGESFFEKVPDYGIRLMPINGHPVSIAGYYENNGYYSDDLTLVLDCGDSERAFDITDCQKGR